METCCNDLTGATYKYRADGMRVKKVDGLSLDWHVDDQQTGSGHYDDIQSTNKNTTRYYHDGQMGMEEDYTYNVPGGFDVKVTRYALGGRGIEMISQFYNGTAMTNGVTFPLYDGHGNMVSTIRRDSASPYYVVSNVRTYDAWGLIRSGSATDDPAQRYCANLGHRVDNETEGLIYMRARYYEPWTGRFVSEDPALDGWNWIAYANSDPVNRVDRTGRFSLTEEGTAISGAEVAEGSGGGTAVMVKQIAVRGLRNIYEKWAKNVLKEIAPDIDFKSFKKAWHKFKQKEKFDDNADIVLDPRNGDLYIDGGWEDVIGTIFDILEFLGRK